MDTSDIPSPEGRRRPRKGHGRVTLHDIAEQAGVTRITVSRYLRDPVWVSRETAARIQQAVDALGYVPNHQAGQLASGHSRIVAALIPNIGNSIFAETIQGLTEGLAHSGYELMLMSNGYSLEREVEQLRAVMGWSPAAVIVTGRQHLDAAQTLLQRACAQGTTVLQLWDYQTASETPPEGIVQVGFNHGEVGRLMARHLIEGGHRELAFADSGVLEDYRAHERAEGFVQAARRARMRVRLVKAPIGDAFDGGRAVLLQLRELHPEVSAVAFANDQLACGALMQAAQMGLKVPDTLAMLGFGDFPIGRQLQPALSTMRAPRAEIGHAAADIVLKSLREGTPPESRWLPCELVARQSTGPVQR